MAFDGVGGRFDGLELAAFGSPKPILEEALSFLGVFTVPKSTKGLYQNPGSSRFEVQCQQRLEAFPLFGALVGGGFQPQVFATC